MEINGGQGWNYTESEKVEDSSYLMCLLLESTETERPINTSGLLTDSLLSQSDSSCMFGMDTIALGTTTGRYDTAYSYGLFSNFCICSIYNNTVYLLYHDNNPH